MPYTPLELAEAFLKTGELNDALDALNQHLTDHPDDDPVRRLRIETLLRLNHFSEAANDFDALQMPDAGDHLKRSIVCEKSGDLDAALSALSAALQRQPDDERLIERQVYLLQKRGDLQPALRVVNQILGRSPAAWRWHQWAGDLAAQIGQQDTAVGHYDAALTQLEAASEGMAQTWAHPLKGNLLLARAAVYRTLNQFSEAEADYAAAAVLIPDDPLIPFQRGLIALMQGDESGGLALCQQAWQAASPLIQAEMKQELATDPKYAGVAAKLN